MDAGDIWADEEDIRALRVAQKAERKAREKAHRTKVLTESGLKFTSSNDGENLMFRESGKPKVDFYPSSGKWRVAGIGGGTMMEGGVQVFLGWYAKQTGPKKHRGSTAKDNSDRANAPVESSNGRYRFDRKTYHQREHPEFSKYYPAAKFIHCWTDGSYVSQKDIGAWGYLVSCKAKNQEHKGGGLLTSTHASRCELWAIIHALTATTRLHGNGCGITIYSDLQEVEAVLMGHRQPTTNLDLWQQINDLIAQHQHEVNEKGYKFSTYATWWVRQAITRAVAEKSRTIRLPVHLHEKVNQIKKATKLLSQELGRKPTEEELAARMEMTVDKLRFIAHSVQVPRSLNQTINPHNHKGEDSDNTLEDFIDSPEAEPEVNVDRQLLRGNLEDLLSTLNPRQRDVIRMRFGLDDGQPKTLEEIGQVLKVTRERIRQIELKALRQLRRPHLKKQLEGYLEES